MTPGIMHKIRQHVVWWLNRTAIHGYKLWMTTILAFRRVLDRLDAEILRMRRETTPRQVIVSVIFVAVVATPMTLYLLERGRHIDQQRAYRALFMSSVSEAIPDRSTTHANVRGASLLAIRATLPPPDPPVTYRASSSTNPRAMTASTPDIRSS